MQGNRLVVGILAHVDAGKTTLAEGLLYLTGRIRRLGRVDHRNAVLDNFALERERGITIFSKQAQISFEGLDITLLDTPGHVDFGAEMERTLQVLDYAVLLVSGADGIQGHTQTVWKLLGQYGIPVFIFVNKMDQPGTDRERLRRELQAKLDGGCQEFGAEAEKFGEAFWEELALCEEGLMEEYLETGSIGDASIARAVAGRQVFPCYFGAALHLRGVEELLLGIRRFSIVPSYSDAFGARVFKISRDASGGRLTHLKVTGGSLRVKMPVGNRASAASAEEAWEEKADQLRVYSGAGYSAVEQVEAGGVCAATGLERTFAGEGLGAESRNAAPLLAPVLTYGLVLPAGCDVVRALGQLRKLEEEEPQLHLAWQEGIAGAGSTSDGREALIHVQVMGEVQIEVLKRLISDRFGLEVGFTDGRILYKETIAGAAEGIGHFEPLRHYAEVHLLLEPGERGSGLQLETACSGDVLDAGWQRVILSHLRERTHPGVLTGAPVTDMKITLLTGRAHARHTEGGDFRQAAYRALRQGLMCARSVLLEPVFSFSLEVPSGQVGRAMSDIQRMHGSFGPPLTEGERSVLTGSAPVAAMRDYQREVAAYTRGLGRLSYTLKGYEPCHNAEEVIARSGYRPEADADNPADSIFCAHGAGFVVPWDRVAEYAHVESGRRLGAEPEEAGEQSFAPRREASRRTGGSDYITQEEIEEIFRRTYGKEKKDCEPYRYHRQNTGRTGSGVVADQEEGTVPGEGMLSGEGEAPEKSAALGGKTAPEAGGRREKASPVPPMEEYLLVDGYNIIFAWEDLRELAERNIDSARDRLMDICCNYQGFAGCILILVFDAYKVKGGSGSVQKYHNIHVVYTKEAETADQYIEKTVHEIGRKHRVTVATSDRLEQMIIWGAGASRMSAEGFRSAVEGTAGLLQERYAGRQETVRNRPFGELGLLGTLGTARK